MRGRGGSCDLGTLLRTFFYLYFFNGRFDREKDLREETVFWGFEGGREGGGLVTSRRVQREITVSERTKSSTKTIWIFSV